MAIGSLLNAFGGYWDLSEHLITGIVPGGEDFLWPPHLMVYTGFLLAFVVAVSGLVAIAIPNLKQGVKDPRRWVRRNPYVGAVVLMAGYGLLSIPGDAIWHELYGIDLTAWSPPHVFLTISAVSLTVFAAGLFQKSGAGMAVRSQKSSRPEDARSDGTNDGRALVAQKLGKFASTVDWLSFLRLFYMANALILLVFIGVVEWEVESINRLVAERPVWLYPNHNRRLFVFPVGCGKAARARPVDRDHSSAFLLRPPHRCQRLRRCNERRTPANDARIHPRRSPAGPDLPMDGTPWL